LIPAVRVVLGIGLATLLRLMALPLLREVLMLILLALVLTLMLILSHEILLGLMA
jgi:hypothetical protein